MNRTYSIIFDDTRRRVWCMAAFTISVSILIDTYRGDQTINVKIIINILLLRSTFSLKTTRAGQIRVSLIMCTFLYCNVIPPVCYKQYKEWGQAMRSTQGQTRMSSTNNTCRRTAVWNKQLRSIVTGTPLRNRYSYSWTMYTLKHALELSRREEKEYNKWFIYYTLSAELPQCEAQSPW